MLSNYQIKKMIPRLIIAAILVNASFWIAALAVDLSNLLGYNIAQLMNGIDIGDQGVNQFDESWNTILAGILAVGASIALLVAIIMAPSALLAFAMIILILTARKALIILMIVIAPVAFVAWLLPNTESFFKRWYQIFLALLLVFPITALVFGASSLASDVILNVARTSTGGDETEDMLYVVALGITAIPLFAVPALLFGALKAIGSIGAKIDAYGNRSMSGATAKAKQKTGGFVGGIKKDAGSRFRIAANNPDSRLQTGKLGKIGRPAAKYSRWKSRRDKLRDARSSAADRAEAVRYSEELTGSTAESQQSDEAKAAAKAKAEKLQRAAAGGTFGANEAARTRAYAQATKVGFKQFDEDVEAYQMTLTSMSNDELVAELKKGEGSKEYQAAVAGAIMKRNHRDSHLAALRIMGERARQADAADDAQEKDIITDVQKQMFHDMRDKPWALGDQAAGQLQYGTYGYATSNTGEPQTHLGNIDTEMKDRVLKKLSTQGLASMNPDEMRQIYKMATGKYTQADIDAGIPQLRLDAAELSNLQQKIEDVKDSRYKDDIKPEAQKWFGEIEQIPNPGGPKVQKKQQKGQQQQQAQPQQQQQQAQPQQPQQQQQQAQPVPQPAPQPTVAPSSPWPQAAPTSQPTPPNQPSGSTPDDSSTTRQGKTYDKSDGGLYIPRD